MSKCPPNISLFDLTTISFYYFILFLIKKATAFKMTDIVKSSPDVLREEALWLS